MLATMLPSSRPWKEPTEPKRRLSASRSLGDEVEALRPAVARDPDRVAGREVEGHLGFVGLAAGDQAAGGVARGEPAPAVDRVGASEREPLLSGDGVHRIAVEIPAQVVEAAHEQARAVRQRHAVEGAAPGRGLPPPFAQRIHREHVQHAVAVRGEVDPAVLRPVGRLVLPRPRGERGDAYAVQAQQEQVGGPLEPVGGPVGGEDDALSVGARCGIEVLVAIRRERLQRSLGQVHAVDVGDAALREAADHDAATVGHPVGREQRHQLGELVAPPYLAVARGPR